MATPMKDPPETSTAKIAHDLTDAEVALAKVLAALESYPEPARLADGRVANYTRENGRMWGVACAVGDDLWDRAKHSPTCDGRALLERARKAGVL